MFGVGNRFIRWPLIDSAINIGLQEHLILNMTLTGQIAKRQLLDPDTAWLSGAQYPNGKEIFGMFTDSMPDTWGTTLMKKRAAQLAKEAGKTVLGLFDIDFLMACMMTQEWGHFGLNSIRKAFRRITRQSP